MLFMRLRGKAGKIIGRDSEKSERIQGSWNLQSRNGFCAFIPKSKNFCNKNKGFEIGQPLRKQVMKDRHQVLTAERFFVTNTTLGRS